jgi:hypothetical protein
MSLSKGRKRMIIYARKELRHLSKYQHNDDLYFGVRFMSDKLLEEKIKEGKSVLEALKELAQEDFRGL